MSVVKIVNQNPYDWRGIECLIDGKPIPRVKSVDFHVEVNKVPIFNLELMATPDIEMKGLARLIQAFQEKHKYINGVFEVYHMRQG